MGEVIVCDFVLLNSLECIDVKDGLVRLVFVNEAHAGMQSTTIATKSSTILLDCKNELCFGTTDGV